MPRRSGGDTARGSHHPCGLSCEAGRLCSDGKLSCYFITCSTKACRKQPLRTGRLGVSRRVIYHWSGRSARGGVCVFRRRATRGAVRSAQGGDPRRCARRRSLDTRFRDRFRKTILSACAYCKRSARGGSGFRASLLANHNVLRHQRKFAQSRH